MSNETLQQTLDELNISDFVRHSSSVTIAGMIANAPNDSTQQPDPEELPYYGLVYEQLGISEFRSLVADQEGASRDAVQSYFQFAYTCWKALSLLPEDENELSNGHISTKGLALASDEFRDDHLSTELLLAFRLGIAGLLSGHTAEIRLDLAKFALRPVLNNALDWGSRVTENIFCSFVLLIRKGNGWGDIRTALSNIDTLRNAQKEYEEKYITRYEQPIERRTAALELVGLYHLAQLVTLVGEYLQTGQPGRDKVNTRLDTHYERAIEAFEAGRQIFLQPLADLLWAGCRELVRNAIWSHINARQGGLLQQYIKRLTSPDRQHPIIELWSSQQEALHKHLLDFYQRAILVEMPTSAGKTLLAHFNIAYTKSLLPDSLVVYIVPTRALINQATLDLRTRFHSLLRIEQTVPVSEIDPSEDQLLQSRIDVLVTTPEKLDLLIRANHKITQNISLVIADEAHTIGEGSRGIKLELLLGTIKRDYPDVQFLLLSPFLPNSQEIVNWLGEDRSLPPIRIDWRPNSKVVGLVQSVRIHNKQWILELETLESIYSYENSLNTIQPHIKLPVGTSSSRIKTQKELTPATARAFTDKGAILIICKGSGTSVTRAREVAADREIRKDDELLDAVIHFAETELGSNNSLSWCLSRGVAYHHSGLSLEARWLIEELIRENKIDVVCGTTTLAQGVNFPIKTVIIESLKKGDADLTHQDFWNIAGRAGRTLVDTLGIVLFANPNEEAQEHFRQFVKNNAGEVASQIINLIKNIQELDIKFNFQFLEKNPSFSPLLQFLAHAMRISGDDSVVEEVEDLLRSSLVYYQVRKKNTDEATKLVRICRSYMMQTAVHRPILELADQTGFSTPSVLELLSQKQLNRHITNPFTWHPDRLFGKSIGPLAERIKMIAHIPELGLSNKEDLARFSPGIIANILQDWVNGKSIEEMGKKYSAKINKMDIDQQNKQIESFAKDLFNITRLTSWGLGALETVCLSDSEQRHRGDAGYIPSMVYFGVRQREALLLRQIGVPRIMANGLATVLQKEGESAPQEHDDIRTWVSHLKEREWRHAIPTESTLTPQDAALIWKVFSGDR